MFERLLDNQQNDLLWTQSQKYEIKWDSSIDILKWVLNYKN